MRQEKLSAAWAEMTEAQRLTMLGRLHIMAVSLTASAVGEDQVEFDRLARRAGLVGVYVPLPGSDDELPGAVGPHFARGMPRRALDYAT